MSPEEAQALIDKDPNNADVLRPYLGGEDLNQSPTQTAPRWIINFFDWPEEKARKYPDCFSIVEEKVRPSRGAQGRTAMPQRRLWWRYWIYAEKRPKAVPDDRAAGQSVLAISLTSQQVGPAVLRSRRGRSSHRRPSYSPTTTDFHFGVLTCGFHYRWAVRHRVILDADGYCATRLLMCSRPLPSRRTVTLSHPPGRLSMTAGRS